ncbi:MAG: hypothetical protein DRI57_29065, partial [Deltaproteobacteria bacterium]
MTGNKYLTKSFRIFSVISRMPENLWSGTYAEKGGHDMVTDTFAGDMPNLTEHSYFPFGEDTENREKFPNTGHLPYPRSPLIFPRTEASPHFPDALFGTLLNIPDVAVE